MRWLAHFYHLHPYAYWAIFALLPVAHFVLVRRNRKKIVALLDLFDPGTAEFEKDAGAYVARGLFHGRPASVSAERRLLSKIEVCIAGRFYLPFETQTPRWRWIYGSQKAMNFAGAWLHFFFAFVAPAYALLGRPDGSIWNWLGPLVVLYIAIGLIVYCYGKLKGYFDEAPISMCAVDLGAIGTRRFATYRPDRFNTAVVHPEIRESFAHLFDSCGADALKMPGAGRLNIEDRKKWIFSLEATWLGRDAFLDKETVRRALSELATLCTELDQYAPDPMLAWTRG